MKPESILHADILDIIFENRNKEYGAYELRTHYNERLIRSMLTVFFLLVTIWGLVIWLLPKDHRIFIKPPSITDWDIQPLSQPDKPLTHSANHPIARRLAEITHVTPTIVPSSIPVKPIPTVQDLDDNNIGAHTEIGEKKEGTPGPGATTNQIGSPEAPPAPEEAESVLRVAECMPEFPGGMEALKRFLSNNLRVPKDNLEAGEKIKVVVKFVVDKEGIVTDLAVTEHGGNEFDEEVIRVMKKMPQWKPGMQNGKKVAVYYYLPVTFQGSDEN